MSHPPLKSKRHRTPSFWKRQAIALASKIARQRAGNACEWCGRTDCRVNAAHIVPVEYEATAADPGNITCLCFACHKLRWHGHPLLAAAWFARRFGPERVARALLVKRNRRRKPREWFEIYQRLTEEEQ